MTLLGLLNQSITIYAKSGYDAYGRASMGASVAVSARVQEKTIRRLLPNGNIVTILIIVYVPAGTAVNTDDKVTFSGRDYKVYGKYSAVDGAGDTNHIKLELIKWV